MRLSRRPSRKSSNEYSGWISFRMDWFDPLAVQETVYLVAIPEEAGKPGCVAVRHDTGELVPAQHRQRTP